MTLQNLLATFLITLFSNFTIADDEKRLCACEFTPETVISGNKFETNRNLRNLMCTGSFGRLLKAAFKNVNTVLDWGAGNAFAGIELTNAGGDVNGVPLLRYAFEKTGRAELEYEAASVGFFDYFFYFRNKKFNVTSISYASNWYNPENIAGFNLPPEFKYLVGKYFHEYSESELLHNGEKFDLVYSFFGVPNYTSPIMADFMLLHKITSKNAKIIIYKGENANKVDAINLFKQRAINGNFLTYPEILKNSIYSTLFVKKDPQQEGKFIVYDFVEFIQNELKDFYKITNGIEINRNALQLERLPNLSYDTFPNVDLLHYDNSFLPPLRVYLMK